MTPALELQVLNLAEQLKVRHSLYLSREEAQHLLAVVHGQASWNRLIAADKHRTLPDDVPAQSERLARALKDFKDLSLTAHQAALVLITPPPAKLSKKDRSARFWRLDLNFEEEALWFLDLRCSGPARSRPPVLFHKMTASDLFNVDPDERGLQPAQYLGALAKLGLDDEDKDTLRGFSPALGPASKLLERADDFETAENLLVVLSQIFRDRDEAPGDFDDWIEQNMFDNVQMETWMLERAFDRHETVALEVHIPDEDTAKPRPLFKILLPISDLPKGSKAVKLPPTDYLSTLRRTLNIDAPVTDDNLPAHAAGKKKAGSDATVPDINVRQRLKVKLEQALQARGYRTAPIKPQLAQDDPRFEIGFELWKGNMAMHNIGVTNRNVQESLYPEPEELAKDAEGRTTFRVMTMPDIEDLMDDLGTAAKEVRRDLLEPDSGDAND